MQRKETFMINMERMDSKKAEETEAASVTSSTCSEVVEEVASNKKEK